MECNTKLEEYKCGRRLPPFGGCGGGPPPPPPGEGPPTCFDESMARCSTIRMPQRRCPDGNRAERTYAIVPKANVFPKDAQSSWRTTYQNDFILRCGDKPKLFKPPRPVWRTEKQYDWDSVYRTEYIPHCRQPCETFNWNKEKDYHPPIYPMNAQSTYNRDYFPKKGAPAKTTKKKFYLETNPPLMEDQTCYRVAFMPYPKTDRDCPKTKEELLVEFATQCVPFDGITTYKRDYNPWPEQCPVESVKPKRILKNKLPFDDRTIYRGSYEPFYYDDGQYEGCIQAEEYDSMFPKKKCNCD